MTIATSHTILSGLNAPHVIVWMSGGKDSIATLSLVLDVYPREKVTCAFMQLIPGIRCELAPIERTVALFRVPLITTPHWQLSHYLRRSVLRPPMLNKDKPRPLRQADIEQYVMGQIGQPNAWHAGGQREVESLVRLAYLRKLRNDEAAKTGRQLGGVDTKFRRVYPIWDWKTKDVYSFMKVRKIPISAPLGQRYKGQSSGIGITAPQLTWLCREHPEDFARLEAIFPYARAQVLRAEIASQDSDKAVSGKS